MSIPLGSLRTLANRFLPDTCTIRRATDTSGGDGTGQSWSDLATGVACRVSPRGRAVSESVGASEAIRAASDWTVWLPALQDVTVRDRIVVGSRTFEVNTPTARSYETARAVLCREIT